MKKKIAVIANGWNNLSITQAVKGIRAVTDKLNIDVFVFLSYAAFAQTEVRNKGENAIYDLVDYSEFDGVIVFSAMLNRQDVAVEVCHKIAEKNPVCVSVGQEVEGVDYIGIDNFEGMYAMVSHLVEKHNIKNPVFLAGPESNVDSNERLEATRLALQDHGIKLKRENIKYTNWEYLKSIDYTVEFAKSENKPDAFVCANDYIAIGACVGLEREGFSVPNDFIVTGFDRISYADTFYPSITTVYQDYEKLGYMSVWHLLEKINGTAKKDKITISSEYVLNESCGCKKSAEAEVPRHDFCVKAYANEMEDLIFQNHTSDISSALFNCTNFTTFKKKINKSLQESHMYEGNNFYIIIDSNAMKSFKNSSFSVKKTFSKKMECLVGIADGKFGEFKPFNVNDIIPEYSKKDTPFVYTICSLHYDDYVFGYIALTDALNHIADNSLNNYMLQMNNNLEKYRQNSKLEEMNKALLNVSIKDQLTGLYNRFGMEKYAVPLFEKSKKGKNACALIFADINRMKQINDNFGHLHGDLALRTVASSIFEELPENWINIRYGGDEFISIGSCCDEVFIKDVITRLNNNLGKKVAAMKLSYSLKISCGYIITDPASAFSLNDYINQADTLMYVHKQKSHEEEKETAVSPNIKSLDELPRL